jgi:hypothetical protein
VRPNKIEKWLDNGKALYVQFSDLEPANETLIVIGDSRVRCLIDNVKSMEPDKIQWIWVAVSGGCSNSIYAAFDAIESLISGQKVTLIVSAGINDILNSGPDLNVELLATRIIRQTLSITARRSIKTVVITSIIPSLKTVNVCARANFLLQLLATGRFLDGYFLNLQETYSSQDSLRKELYTWEGLHFNPPGMHIFKALIRYWSKKVRESEDATIYHKERSVLRRL